MASHQRACNTYSSVLFCFVLIYFQWFSKRRCLGHYLVLYVSETVFMMRNLFILIQIMNIFSLFEEKFKIDSKFQIVHYTSYKYKFFTSQGKSGTWTPNGPCSGPVLQIWLSEAMAWRLLVPLATNKQAKNLLVDTNSDSVILKKSLAVLKDSWSSWSYQAAWMTAVLVEADAKIWVKEECGEAMKKGLPANRSATQKRKTDPVPSCAWFVWGTVNLDWGCCWEEEEALLWGERVWRFLGRWTVFLSWDHPLHLTQESLLGREPWHIYKPLVQEKQCFFPSWTRSLTLQSCYGGHGSFSLQCAYIFLTWWKLMTVLPELLLRDFWSLYNQGRRCVCILGTKSTLSMMRVGLRQDCPLSLTLFVVFMKRISRPC